MSKIPFKFFPIPPEFLTDDFLYDPDMMKFIRWIFKRISSSKSTVPLKKHKINLELSPFEFMFGRQSCSLECGITEKKIQGRLNQLKKLKYLKKVVSKSVSTYTVYTLVTTTFTQNSGQHNGQHSGQHMGQHMAHNLEEKKTRYKEKNHPSIPSKSNEVNEPDSGLMIDDFSSKGKIEIYKEIFLTQHELDACVKIKGDIEKVKQAIEFIQNSKRRKHEISDWPNALAKWKIENKANVRVEDNLHYAKTLCKEFEQYKQGQGCRCYMYTDKKKDQTGILFEFESAYKQAIFFSFVDGEFKQKCDNTIKTNKMRKKL